MNTTLQTLMRDATRLTRAGQLNEAVAAIQRALGNHAAGATSTPPQAMTRSFDLLTEAPPVRPPPASHRAPASAPPRGDFTTGTHTQASRTLRYKLYVPPGHADRPLPLVVMLHGCTQNPDDFAAGTAMNELACEQGFIVLYPAQSQDANPQRCWNWFKHNHQQRGSGEPAVIAGMTQAVIKAHAIDPRRVYIAGLSAGGAMAAIVAAAYPDVFAAAGVHSGLPGGSASDVAGALAVMSSGEPGLAMGAKAGVPYAPASSRMAVPTIVFHGDQDHTVHPRNGEKVIAAALAGHSAAAQVEQGRAGGGRSFTRRVHRDAAGRNVAEHWVVHGAGHAWSGGRAEGSYTDASGPDATREMLRFFLERPHTGLDSSASSDSL